MLAHHRLVTVPRRLTLILVLYIGIVGPPALAAAMLTGRAGHVFALGRFGASAVRRLLGLRLEVSGLEHVAATARRSIASITAATWTWWRSRRSFPAARGFAGSTRPRWGSCRCWAGRCGWSGSCRWSAANRASAIASVDAAAERLRAGDSFLIAPEGTRARTDELLPFKKGGFVMAIKAQAPVVPVALHGTAEAMPRGRFWVKPSVIRVEVGEPIPTTGLTIDDRDRLTTTVRDRMQAMLQRRR